MRPPEPRAQGAPPGKGVGGLAPTPPRSPKSPRSLDLVFGGLERRTTGQGRGLFSKCTAGKLRPVGAMGLTGGSHYPGARTQVSAC